MHEAIAESNSSFDLECSPNFSSQVHHNSIYAQLKAFIKTVCLCYPSSVFSIPRQTKYFLVDIIIIRRKVTIILIIYTFHRDVAVFPAIFNEVQMMMRDIIFISMSKQMSISFVRSIISYPDLLTRRESTSGPGCTKGG